jgi:hypothetical protein
MASFWLVRPRPDAAAESQQEQNPGENQGKSDGGEGKRVIEDGGIVYGQHLICLIGQSSMRGKIAFPGEHRDAQAA